jgi:hypothetical protein
MITKNLFIFLDKWGIYNISLPTLKCKFSQCIDTPKLLDFIFYSLRGRTMITKNLLPSGKRKEMHLRTLSFPFTKLPYQTNKFVSQVQATELK